MRAAGVAGHRTARQARELAVTEDGLLGSGRRLRPDHGPEPVVERLDVLGWGHGALHRFRHGVEARRKGLDHGRAPLLQRSFGPAFRRKLLA
jgi:hypothetical protein